MPHTVTAEFEKEIARYTGAPFVVAVDNCSNALFLSLMYDNIKGKTIIIPSHTYPSVPCEIIHAGGTVDFRNSPSVLKGAYLLYESRVWDSALRFTCNMYIPESFMCLSFTGPHKHMPLSKGGAILTDNEDAMRWFKRARFSGRRQCSYHEDVFDRLGWNFYMPNDTAARGLLLMNRFYNLDGSPKENRDLAFKYPDLSRYPIYRKGG